MNKKSRTILFTTLFIIFLMISPIIILYSQGYRFDFQKWQLLKTGGVYIKTSLPAADIYIDNKYKNKTGQLLSYDFLAQNLLPQTHTVRVEKSGYLPWEKNLLVKEKIVTQAYVVLFPENINFTKLEEDIKKIYSFDDPKKIILQDNKNQLFFYDLGQKNLILGTGNKILDKILDITMSKDASRIILKASEKSTGKIKFYLLPTDKETLTLVSLKNLDKATSQISFYSNNIIFFTSNQKLYKEALDTQKQTLININPVTAFYLQGDNLFYLQNESLFRQNLITNNTESLLKEPFEINSEISYDIFTYWNKIFIIENKKTIYVLNEKQALEKILTSDEETKFTGFSDKLMFYNNSTLWLYLLRDYESPFFAKAGSIVKISDYPKINHFEWISGEYFVMLDQNNKARISEIDNRDKLNSFEVNKEEASQVWFDLVEKKLYFLLGNNLMVSDKLIP